ncbi:MAG: alpha-L-rhamnosidase [Clostridia bacterium]|nr:alpha-L-rhamnosidase [Clostridia bacterium]
MERLDYVPAGIRDTEFLKDSYVDRRVSRFIAPKRILWKSDSEKAKVENEDSLLKMTDSQVVWNVARPCTLENMGEPAGILIDFGVEFQGSVKIFILNDPQPKDTFHLRVRFGESASEAMAELGGEQNATNDHSCRDQVIACSFMTMPEIGPSGFRFVRIDLLDENQKIELMAVQGIFTYREIKYKGSFECNDERLNKIWNTGAYTVHLNMQNYVWDGIKRDRLVWIGDMHPETSTIQTVFGYDPSVPASLDLIRNTSPLPKIMCKVSSYPIWWIINHYGWYMQNGDLKYLSEQKDYLLGLIDMYSGFIDENGNEQLPPFRLTDWPSEADKQATHAGLQALLYIGMDRARQICEWLGEEKAAKKAEKCMKKLAKPFTDPGTNKQSAALLSLAGLADRGKMLNIIKKDGSYRLSTFYGYYVLKAQALAGDMKGAMDNMRNYWGAMLDVGATTFWEDFNLEWLEGSGRIDELTPAGLKDLHGDHGAYCYVGFRHSLCHGWASGPTPFMSEYVLGFKPVAPGCKKMLIKPDLGDLRWAKGTYPTPYGTIRITHVKNDDGSIDSFADVPCGIEIESSGCNLNINRI